MSIPGFELLDQIAQTTNTTFHRARETATGRVVCLEVFPPPFIEASIEWFDRRRAILNAVALLDHPNIWPVLRVGEVHRTCYFVRPMPQGAFLSHHLHNHCQLRGGGAVEWVRQLALAIQYAHDHGVVHCDLKPNNVLLEPSPSGDLTAHLLGFDSGCVRFLPLSVQESASNGIVGTPRYMSPEQMQGRKPDMGPGPDVWGLGVILYELLSGRGPFEGATIMDLMMAVMQQDPAPLPSIDTDLQRITMRCLRKKAEDRYASAAELADKLARYQRGERTVLPASVSPGKRSLPSRITQSLLGLWRQQISRPST